jgi:multiple sugar transport system substrate-binding protein
MTQSRALGPEPTRRQVLAGMAGISALSLAAGTRGALAQGTSTVQWWDHFQPLLALHDDLIAQYTAAHPEVTVEHQVMNPADMMQSLQLAFRGGQAPDITTIPDSLAVISQLLQSGRFAPLTDAVVLDKPFQTEALFNGMHIIDGKVYSFPTFSFRWHATALWFHKAMMEAAGYDPEIGAKTWDEISDAARKMTKDGKYGLLLPLQFTGRMEAHLREMAQLAGGVGPIDWKTGEYAYASDAFVDSVEFLLSFQKDNTLHPASSSLDARQGRVRWAAGEAGMFLDGPWNSGSLLNIDPVALDGIGVQSNPTNGANGTVHLMPAVGTFWVTSDAKDPENASGLLSLMTSDEFYVALAERMDQPPLDLSAVERANVHPSYKTVIAGYKDSVRLAPEPLIRNPDIAQVYAEMRTISPGIGEIIQGVFAGAVPDVRQVLQDYQDAMTAERDRAIKVATDNGATVSVDDWAFPNWQMGKDFAPDQY